MRSSKDAGALLDATKTTRVNDGIIIYSCPLVHRSLGCEGQYVEGVRPEVGSKGLLVGAQVAHALHTVPMVKRINNYERHHKPRGAITQCLIFPPGGGHSSRGGLNARTARTRFVFLAIRTRLRRL